MKTMRYFALAAAVAALAGCSKQEPAQIETPEADHEVYLTVRASSADTRTAISPGYAIRWAEGDAIGLFYNINEIKAEWENIYVPDMVFKNGEIQNLQYPISAGAGTSTAAFSYEDYVAGDTRHPAVGYYSGNFYWQDGASQTTLYAYYPYYYDAASGSAYKVESMPFLLPPVQAGSLESVAAYDLACASATIMRGDGDVVKGEASFNFKHLFSILEITVENTLSDAVTVESVAVSAAAGSALTGDCTLDLTKGEVTMEKKAVSGSTSAGVSQPSVMLSPAKGVVVPSKETAKLYAVVAPCDLSGATVRVTTTGGYQDFEVTGVMTEAGKYYKKSVSLSDLTPNPVVKTIDFEDVQLGQESQNGYVDRTYDNVYSPLGADKSTWQLDDSELAQFGTMYSGNGVEFNGFYYDEYLATWGGFGFSSNVTTEFMSDYKYQFHAVSAGGSGKFSVVYDLASTGWGPGYEPVVAFTNVVEPLSVDVTNMAMLGDYMSDKPAVTFVGYLSGEKSGEVTFSLVDVKEWTEVDLRALGKIDRMVVVMSGNPSRTPFYVCLDNLKYTEAE